MSAPPTSMGGFNGSMQYHEIADYRYTAWQCTKFVIRIVISPWNLRSFKNHNCIEQAKATLTVEGAVTIFGKSSFKQSLSFRCFMIQLKNSTSIREDSENTSSVLSQDINWYVFPLDRYGIKQVVLTSFCVCSANEWPVGSWLSHSFCTTSYKRRSRDIISPVLFGLCICLNI